MTGSQVSVPMEPFSGDHFFFFWSQVARDVHKNYPDVELDFMHPGRWLEANQPKSLDEGK